MLNFLKGSYTNQYAPPQNSKFTLTPAKFNAIMPEYLPGKRMRLRKSWTSESHENHNTIYNMDSAVRRQSA